MRYNDLQRKASQRTFGLMGQHAGVRNGLASPTMMADGGTATPQVTSAGPGKAPPPPPPPLNAPPAVTLMWTKKPMATATPQAEAPQTLMWTKRTAASQSTPTGDDAEDPAKK